MGKWGRITGTAIWLAATLAFIPALAGADALFSPGDLVGAGDLIVGLGGSYGETTFASGNKLSSTGFSLYGAYGLTERLALDVSAPFVRKEFDYSGGPTINDEGLSDVAAGLRFSFLQSRESAANWDLYAFFFGVAPTGSRNVLFPFLSPGRGDYQLGGGLAANWRSPVWRISGSTRYWYDSSNPPLTGADYGDSFSLGFSLARRIIPFDPAVKRRGGIYIACGVTGNFVEGRGINGAVPATNGFSLVVTPGIGLFVGSVEIAADFPAVAYADWMRGFESTDFQAVVSLTYRWDGPAPFGE